MVVSILKWNSMDSYGVTCFIDDEEERPLYDYVIDISKVSLDCSGMPQSSNHLMHNFKIVNFMIFPSPIRSRIC